MVRNNFDTSIQYSLTKPNKAGVYMYPNLKPATNINTLKLKRKQ